MSHTTTVKSVRILDVDAIKKAVKELQQSGVACELIKNAKPRLYYADQLTRQKGRSSEIAPYVLRLNGAVYDLCFLESTREDAKKGELELCFDNYVPSGKVGVKHVLGQKWDGGTSHWAGNRDDTQETLHAVGKFLQPYAKHALVNAARKAGHQVAGTSVDNEGRIHLRLKAS